MLHRLFRSFNRDQRGITGLETAIILIAFVVVASVFAYTVLSAGLFSAEKAKEAVFSGLETVRSSMIIAGPVLAMDTNSDDSIDEIVFVLSNAVAGEAVNLTRTADTDNDGLLSDETKTHALVVTYIDLAQRVTDITWTASQIGKGDDDFLLETGEKFEFTVTLFALSPALGANDNFVIELKPSRGASITIERTTPAVVSDVMDLR